MLSSFIKNINEYLNDTNSLSQKEKVKLSYESGLFFPAQRSKHSFAYNWIFPSNRNRKSNICITEETLIYTYNDNPMFVLNIKSFYIGEYIDFLDFLHKNNVTDQ